MKYNEINQEAWEIAAQSIMLKNRRFETYSKSQIRGFFELAKSNNFKNDLNAHITSYTPQPSQGQNPNSISTELNKMKELNEIIGKRILNVFEKYSPPERMRFSQYLMWDIKIIEQEIENIDKLQLILKCENVEEPTLIINHLTNISQSSKRQSSGPKNPGWRG